jgi:hypothetical protein
MTFYYHLNEYLICAICAWVCSYEPMLSKEPDPTNPLTVPQDRIAFCTNTGCAQYLKRFTLKPISVELTEVGKEEAEAKEGELEEGKQEEETKSEK